MFPHSLSASAVRRGRCVQVDIFVPSPHLQPLYLYLDLCKHLLVWMVQAQTAVLHFYIWGTASVCGHQGCQSCIHYVLLPPPKLHFFVIWTLICSSINSDILHRLKQCIEGFTNTGFRLSFDFNMQRLAICWAEFFWCTFVASMIPTHSCPVVVLLSK